MAVKLIVKLGQPRSTLLMAVAPELGVRVIGTVQRGCEFGYLAMSPLGEYLQVNGSVARVLNASQVRAAMRSAVGPRERQRPTFQRSDPPPEKPPAVVIVRKKRRVVALAATEKGASPCFTPMLHKC